MSITTIQSEDWITRADMAALMRSSEDTVRRAEKKHQLQTREDDAGRVLVNVGDFVGVGLLSPEDLTVGATPAESAEVLRARETVTALKAQVAELTGRLGAERPGPRHPARAARASRTSRSPSRPPSSPSSLPASARSAVRHEHRAPRAARHARHLHSPAPPTASNATGTPLRREAGRRQRPAAVAGLRRRAAAARRR